jgi:ABC-type antimicrobial peptide transport system permease subunit
MERVRELGLLGAIGMTPWRVGWLVILETVVLAVVAMTAGFVVGYGAHLAISTYGIDLTALYGGSEIELSGVALTDMTLRSHLDAGRWINATVTVFALVIMSALYPAWRAARLAPADAMRFYG